MLGRHGGEVFDLAQFHNELRRRTKHPSTVNREKKE
jgi:hypothetical protein